jgi:hypothetical protein
MSDLGKISEEAIRGARWAIAVQDWGRIGGSLQYYIRILSHIQSWGYKYTLSVLFSLFGYFGGFSNAVLDLPSAFID